MKKRILLGKIVSTVVLSTGLILAPTCSFASVKESVPSPDYVMESLSESRDTLIPTVAEWESVADDEYPVDIDDPEWKTFQDHISMTKSCDMPNALVKEMSTEELLEKAVNYPLLCDLFAYDSIEIGLDALKRQSNIIRELADRIDLTAALLERYDSIEIQSASGDYEEDFDNVAETVLVEGLLADEYLKGTMSKKEERRMYALAEEVQAEKELSDLYEGVPESFAKVLELNESDAIKGGKKLSATVNAAAAKKAANPPKTPNGSPVECYKNKYNGDAWSKELTEYYKRAYPAAQALRKADNRYNCHSYAWYKQKEGNVFWIPNPKVYVTDKSYTYAGKKATTKGHKIVYKYQNGPKDEWVHSGIVYDKNIITSKWGQAPLMRHKINYCPYSGEYNVVHTYKRTK